MKIHEVEAEVDELIQSYIDEGKPADRLVRLFDELNHKFFRGRLPVYRVKERAPRYQGDEGCCTIEGKMISIVSSLGRWFATLSWSSARTCSPRRS
jgi:hypothetical protein